MISNSSGSALDPGGASAVAIQDQTTPAFFVKANKVLETTTLAVAAGVGDFDITVASATGIVPGRYVGIFNTTTNRFYAAHVLAVVGAVLTMDTPIDSAFEIGDTVGSGITNLASVDGTPAAPHIFAIRGADPGIAVTIDITRIIISCIADNAVDLTTFGDIVGGLINGLVMRRVDGITTNLINWKTNQEIAGSMYDFNVQAASNPVQGVDGFVARLTFGGQSKLGVVVRLAPGEELQFLVQDLLDTLGLNLLEVMAEGHVTVP